MNAFISSLRSYPGRGGEANDFLKEYDEKVSKKSPERNVLARKDDYNTEQKDTAMEETTRTIVENIKTTDFYKLKKNRHVFENTTLSKRLRQKSISFDSNTTSDCNLPQLDANSSTGPILKALLKEKLQDFNTKSSFESGLVSRCNSPSTSETFEDTASPSVESQTILETKPSGKLENNSEMDLDEVPEKIFENKTQKNLTRKLQKHLEKETLKAARTATPDFEEIEISKKTLNAVQFENSTENVENNVSANNKASKRLQKLEEKQRSNKIQKGLQETNTDNHNSAKKLDQQPSNKKSDHVSINRKSISSNRNLNKTKLKPSKSPMSLPDDSENEDEYPYSKQHMVDPRFSGFNVSRHNTGKKPSKVVIKDTEGEGGQEQEPEGENTPEKKRKSKDTPRKTKKSEQNDESTDCTSELLKKLLCCKISSNKSSKKKNNYDGCEKPKDDDKQCDDLLYLLVSSMVSKSCKKSRKEQEEMQQFIEDQGTQIGTMADQQTNLEKEMHNLKTSAIMYLKAAIDKRTENKVEKMRAIMAEIERKKQTYLSMASMKLTNQEIELAELRAQVSQYQASVMEQQDTINRQLVDFQEKEDDLRKSMEKQIDELKSNHQKEMELENVKAQEMNLKYQIQVQLEAQEKEKELQDKLMEMQQENLDQEKMSQGVATDCQTKLFEQEQEFSMERMRLQGEFQEVYMQLKLLEQKLEMMEGNGGDQKDVSFCDFEKFCKKLCCNKEPSMSQSRKCPPPSPSISCGSCARSDSTDGSTSQKCYKTPQENAWATPKAKSKNTTGLKCGIDMSKFTVPFRLSNSKQPPQPAFSQLPPMQPNLYQPPSAPQPAFQQSPMFQRPQAFQPMDGMFGSGPSQSPDRYARLPTPTNFSNCCSNVENVYEQDAYCLGMDSNTASNIVLDIVLPNY